MYTIKVTIEATVEGPDLSTLDHNTLKRELNDEAIRRLEEHGFIIVGIETSVKELA